MPIRLEIPGATPPSLNKMGSRGNWRVWTMHKTWWQDQVGRVLMTTIQPKRELTTPVLVDAVLWFKTKRQRDEGNFRTLLEKSTGDALVAGGWIPDDTPEHYQFRSVKFMNGKVCTTLLLREGFDDGSSPVSMARAPRGSGGKSTAPPRKTNRREG
jgi:hypothetical protein